MIKRSLCLLLLSATAYAGDPKYPVSAIPADLLKNAHVVTRLEEITVKMHSLKDLRVIEKRVLTILDENGEEHAGFHEFYDKDKDIRDISGVLYDAQGNVVRKLKKSEVTDLSAVGESLMDDSRVKTHDFHHRIYPYTVEYEVETSRSFTAFLPGWLPQPDEGFAVEQSRLSVTVPEDYKLRYRQFNYKGEPVQAVNKGDKTFTWEVRNLAALEPESMTLPIQQRTTAVFTAPSDFSYGSYTGNMNTWNDFGKFILTLNAGRDQLPDKVKAEVHALTDGLKTPEEKIRTLYQYLQKNTRYISIQLGVGGWQTFDAAYVANKGYGDCKALSNYMFSLLKEAGIRSHYTIVRSGDDAPDIIEDFSMNQFNHIILCVPLGKDTTWLECTSQTLPAGYLSDFTCNRAVLLIDETGGKLARTPRYAMQQNQQLRNIKASINPAGDMSGQVQTVYTGLQQDWCHKLVNNLKPEKQLESLKRMFNLPSYDIAKYNYTAKSAAGVVPEMGEVLDITASSYASVSGKRIFVTPNVLNRSGTKLDPEKKRLSPIQLSYPWKDVDTVQLTIPEGYKLESIFQEVKLEEKYGRYSAKATVNGNQITYVRVMEKNDGVFPATEYEKLAKFYNDIYKADRNRIVFVKAE
ncbi:DUF3857 domain-containing protein [Chitinophaga lutea]|uniref:DUF3857 domain-containing protein n=1 Tax=Chitinophaga lutea TaxID=2488634 RepID=A0A3N4PQ23_9BACT|nr:DUF3857 and transglutaminase domain-containing protein [Chitinophaga lutea]RPE05820.1 DUF3857 domain-containing protein [Chitinophaga lutea]